jgi:hypothetical protein
MRPSGFLNRAKQVSAFLHPTPPVSQGTMTPDQVSQLAVGG